MLYMGRFNRRSMYVHVHVRRAFIHGGNIVLVEEVEDGNTCVGICDP